jgi:hypothetical protein
VNDKELADAMVALGVAEKAPCEKEWWLYFIRGDIPGMTVKDFVTDWRVAGALMEKLQSDHHLSHIYDDGWFVTIRQRHNQWDTAGPYLNRAIIEACVEALKSSRSDLQSKDQSEP